MRPLRRIAWLLVLAGCAVHEPDRLTLTPVGVADLPGWTTEHHAEMLPVFLRNCARLDAMPQDQPLGGQGEAARLGGTPAQWHDVCAEARRIPPHRDRVARAFFERRLAAYAVSDNYRPAPLFTGYYEPELQGDTVPGVACATPLLSPPPDLVEQLLPPLPPATRPRRVYGRMVGTTLRPYFDRTAIEDGAVAASIARYWVRDPVDAFFLQIQGSGRVVLPDGRVRRVGYAAQNGRPFVDIGRLLVARGDLAVPPTLQAVRDWLRAHPVESRAVMDANPSYVFFQDQTLGPEEGPLGAFGLPLTPLRSAAVDAAFVPLGVPLWIDTHDPADGRRLQRMMLAQDVGGAIRGPVRADLFFGWGAEAERHAGGMWGRGGEYVLLPRATGIVTASGG